MTRTLPTETTEALAFDVAVGFFDDEQLSVRYKIERADLDSIRNQPAFQREVDEHRRLLYEDGAEFKAQIRKHMMDVVRFLKDALHNDEAPWSTRMKAAEKLTEWAGFHYMKPKDAGGGSVQLVINTNLGLSNTQGGGSYTIEAERVDEGSDLIGEGQ